MRLLLFVTVAGLAVMATRVFADADTDDDAAQPAAILNALLANRLALEQDISPDLNGVIFGDLDRDDRSDAVVTYSHGVGEEGGNQYSQRIAVLLQRDSGFELVHHSKVGSKGSRFLRPTSIEFGEVMFAVTYWQTDDAMCCPSGVTDARFELIDGTLVEL